MKWIITLALAVVCSSATALCQDTVYVKDTTTTTTVAPSTQDTTKTKEVYVRGDKEEAHETLAGTEAAIKNTLGLGPRAGWYNYSSYNNTDYNVYFGVAARLRISPYIGVEGALDYRPERTYTDASGNTVRQSSVPLTISGMVFLPIAFNFVPYVIGGGGWYYNVQSYTSGSATAVDKNSSVGGYHLGIGLEVPLSEHATLSGDWRWLWVNQSFDSFSSSPAPADANGNAITVALMFYF